MYKIIEIANLKNGNWFKPVTDWNGLKAQGYAGAYILAHQVIKNDAGAWAIQDNLYLDDIFSEAQNNGFRVGFYVFPDGVKISYAKVFQDLAFKQNAFGSSLLPAVVIGQWPAGYNAHLVEGDFIPYFNSILVDRFGDVVLGLNKATADLLVTSGSDVILNTLKKTGVRIWYYRYDLTAVAMSAELLATPAKKSVWIAGVASGVNEADWSSTIDPTPTPTPDNDDLVLAAHFQAIADILKKRGVA